MTELGFKQCMLILNFFLRSCIMFFFPFSTGDGKGIRGFLGVCTLRSVEEPLIVTVIGFGITMNNPIADMLNERSVVQLAKENVHSFFFRISITLPMYVCYKPKR